MIPAALPPQLAKKIRVNPVTGCWEWTAGRFVDHRGERSYARVKWRYDSRKAHRIAYELLVGPVPEGLILDHLCRVRHCVNPAHLEPVTALENTMRGEGPAATNARKTHCKRGHEFTLETTYAFGGRRHCRICQRIRSHERRG